MSRLPLHVLPTFRTVARRLNLRASAEELHLTHSAVSQQIRLLEEQLGFALFERRGRRLVLNAAGAALLAEVEPALERIDAGVRAAGAAVEASDGESLRITALPSFAQRWLLPRMAAWRALHPGIPIELHSSQEIVDLQREDFHAALRTGNGQWRGLVCERLTKSPLIVLGSTAAARRLLGAPPAVLAEQPLLGHAPNWERWFAQAGLRRKVRPVAQFNDAGLMLQAAEQDLGLTLAREVLAADALREGRLHRLSPLAMEDADAYAYWLVYTPALKEWPPIVAFRDWLQRELKVPAPPDLRPAEGTATAGRTGNRTRAPSAPRARGRG